MITTTKFNKLDLKSQLNIVRQCNNLELIVDALQDFIQSYLKRMTHLEQVPLEILM